MEAWIEVGVIEPIERPECFICEAEATRTVHAALHFDIGVALALELQVCASCSPTARDAWQKLQDRTIDP